MSPQSKATSEQKLAALQNRGSNAGEVDNIATTGHAVSTTVGGATMAYGAVGAFSTGGIGAVACYASPLAAGIAGVWAGAKLANHLALDEKVLDLMGKPKLSGPGPQPAVVGDAIAHNHAFAGALTGLLAGVAVGILVAAAVAATVATGGLAAPVLVGAAAALAGGVAGSFVGSIINGIGSKMATVSGKIMTGSPNVFFEGKAVARVTDTVSCDKHSIPPQIAEGSETISVNGLPLARIGHKITCSAVVQDGCKTIFADNTTGQYGEIDAEMSAFEQTVLSVAEVGLAFSAVRFRSSKLGKRVFGEPIDPADGGYVDFRTDFEYPGILPLALTRIYSGKERVEGLLGAKWTCNWSQRLSYDQNEPTVILEDGDGEVLKFALGHGREFNARHLKAPHYQLTGTRENARLFDSRTQQTLIFTATEENPLTGIVTAIEDRNYNRIDFIYKYGRLCRISHSDGAAFSVTTTPEGYLKTVVMEGDNRELVRYTYDFAGAITDVQSLFNGEFHYGYTMQGWLNHWHDSGVTSVDLEYDFEGRVIVTRTPEGLYNDRFIYHPEERNTEYIDATGARSEFWFNTAGLMIRERDPLGHITEHAFDGLERKLSTTDPLGRTTIYDHNTFGFLTGETDWAGRTIGYKYDKHGLITEVQHPDGKKSAWKYDERGNLVCATEPDGSAFRYSYDERGNLLSETGPDNTNSRWEYTKLGRLAAWYDPLGNRTSFEEGAWKRLRSITDASGHTTRYHYDPGTGNPREDVSAIVYPDGGEERFSYDKEGLLSEHTGGEGQVTRYKHGSFDLLRTVIDPAGHITSMEYDGAARLRQITNAAGQRWSYSYDPAGRLAAETDWAGRQTGYRRDAVGRVLSKRLPDGVEQRLTWDERDRIVSVATDAIRIVYEYDDADRLIRAATYGNNVEEPDSDILFSYDKSGRLVKEIQNGIAIDYQYDAAGRCINRKSPSGETSVSYDPLGLLTDYTSNGQGLTFRRNALGLETERRHNHADHGHSAFTLMQSYDPCGRMKTQSAGGGRASVNPAIPDLPNMEMAGRVSRNYHWDKSGRLIGVKDIKRGASSFQYDPRDQVRSVQRQAKRSNSLADERYDYDALMNLAQSDGQAHRYQGDCVTHIGNTSYRHDARGRVIEKTGIKNGFRPKTWRYLWDDFDRLTETRTSDGGHWRYSYDAFGRRVKKECVTPDRFKRTANITYLWQGATLAEEWKTYCDSGEPVQVSRWHFEPGTFNPIAKETLGIGAEKAGEARFYPIVTDHLGTPKELFDVDGQCVWQAEHSLWGKTSIVSQISQDFNELPVADCNLRFQNQWEDEETGLYYNLNRYYDPDSGQYLSTDPIALDGGLRTHGYVHDTMQLVDPMGLAACGKRGQFATSDAAAKAALTRYNKKSIRDNREYGGLIYKTKDGRYGYTKATRGGVDGVNPWQGKQIPKGTDEAGYWHTHGNYSKMKNGKLVPTTKANDIYDSNNFSPQDIRVANSQLSGRSEYRGYVGTPSGNFKGYNALTGTEYPL